MEFIEQHKELLALLLAAVGGVFALWRWMVDQRWRRVPYAQSRIKEFREKKNTIKAFEILDLVDEELEFEPLNNSGNAEKIAITDEFLVGALSTFDQKEVNDDKEVIVRRIFDEFFEDLGNFQSDIDAKLIKAEDIKPYLEYWMGELTGRGLIYNAKFAKQVARYLAFFKYTRVLTLGDKMGYPFDLSNASPLAQGANERVSQR